MQELISKVTNAAGISEEQAKKSIETVSGYIKEKMPESFRSQIDNLVSGGTLSAGIKDKLKIVAGDLRDKTEDVIKDIREKAEETAGKLRDMFENKK